MKKTVLIYLVSMWVVLFSGVAGFAAEKGNSMEHNAHIGKRIHESKVQGYHLAYHLLDLPGRQEQHLMTYIADGSGKPIAKGQVGYLVVGPDGKNQKVMAMAMKDAFGGDVNFTVKGRYTIKAKAVFDDKKLMDEFDFEVK